jgi:DNA-binding Lrp family transcriptional regulator
MYPAQIARALKCSKSNMTKRIQRLLVLGLVTDLKMRPKRYILTDLGKAEVNPPLIHHDKAHRSPSEFYDFHAIEVSYELADKGNLPEGNVYLKNWSYYAEKFGEFSIRVHYGKTNKLIIFPPHIKGDSVLEVYSKLGFTIGEIVAIIQSRYKCEIRPETYHVERRPEVHAPLDPEGKIFEAMKFDMKGKNIEINQSGEGRFDITGERSFLNYDSMIGIFPQFMGTVTEFSKNIMLHLDVLRDQKETLKEIRDNLPKAPQIADLSVKTPDPLVHIETTDIFEQFIAEDRGIIREYPALNAGSKIWLPKSVAEVMINQNRAKPL